VSRPGCGLAAAALPPPALAVGRQASLPQASCVSRIGWPSTSPAFGVRLATASPLKGCKVQDQELPSDALSCSINSADPSHLSGRKICPKDPSYASVLCSLTNGCYWATADIP